MMSETVQAKATRRDALELARRKYLTGERIDIRQLAGELGVNRVTLHRWVGTRDELIVEIVWPLTEATLAQEWAKVERLPGLRLPRLVSGYLRANLFQGPAQRFLLDENDRAMRIFTMASYGYQPRLVNAVRGFLELELGSGRLQSRLSLDELAYITVRIAESFAYLPTITGDDPDPDGAERVLAAFLGGHA
jgi:AcrR family transcriptional regulator